MTDTGTETVNENAKEKDPTGSERTESESKETENESELTENVPTGKENEKGNVNVSGKAGETRKETGNENARGKRPLIVIAKEVNEVQGETKNNHFLQFFIN